MTIQLAYNHDYSVGDLVDVRFCDGSLKSFVVSVVNSFELYYGEIEKTKINIHINKQRAQSKINGKNSRWC